MATVTVILSFPRSKVIVQNVATIADVMNAVGPGVVLYHRGVPVVATQVVMPEDKLVLVGAPIKKVAEHAVDAEWANTCKTNAKNWGARGQYRWAELWEHAVTGTYPVKCVTPERSEYPDAVRPRRSKIVQPAAPFQGCKGLSGGGEPSTHKCNVIYVCQPLGAGRRQQSKYVKTPSGTWEWSATEIIEPKKAKPVLPKPPATDAASDTASIF
jgi:hypothetical protein